VIGIDKSSGAYKGRVLATLLLAPVALALKAWDVLTRRHVEHGAYQHPDGGPGGFNDPL